MLVVSEIFSRLILNHEPNNVWKLYTPLKDKVAQYEGLPLILNFTRNIELTSNFYIKV